MSWLRFARHGNEFSRFWKGIRKHGNEFPRYFISSLQVFRWSVSPVHSMTMASRFLFMFLFCCLFAACADLPDIQPVLPGQIEDVCSACRQVFPNENREFVHSIEITMPGGHKSMMLGVTRIFPETRGLHCAIMSIEGLVIFEARDDGELIIERGLPPFDSVDFARGMMDDIRMIFFEPIAKIAVTGISEDGKSICRYKGGVPAVTDLMCQPDGCTLHRYVNKRRIRSVTADMKNGQVLANGRSILHHIRLQAFGRVRYTLDLTLVQSALLPSGSDSPKK